MKQPDHIQELVQQAATGNREAFAELILAGGPDLRLLLAAHVASFSAIARLELEVWATAAGCLKDYDTTHSFSDWVFAVAVAPLTEHLREVIVRSSVVQDVVTHHLADDSLKTLSNGSELSVLKLAAMCEALPENTRALLTARYRDRHSLHLIASRQGGDEPALANALVAARARCDWRGMAKPPVASDRDLPPAIEDVLSGIIDNASRALMADYLARGQQQVQQIARQMRVHVALRVMFMPFTRMQATALVHQALACQASPGGTMAGQVVLNAPVHVPVVPRVVIISDKLPASPAVPLDKAGTVSSRSSSVSVRIDEDDQEDWPVARKKKPPRRTMLVPALIVGVLVLGGAIGLLVTNRSKAPSPPVVAVNKWNEPAAPLPAPENKPTAVLPAPTPVETGALHPLPPPVPEKPVGGPLQVKLVGVVADNHQYAGRELVLRSVLSSNDGIARVEYWNGETKLGEAVTAPWTYTWTPAAGALSLTARAVPQAGETTTSPAITLTVMTVYGSGGLRREWWTGIPGDQLQDLDKIPGFPARPQGHELVNQFASPENSGDNYLQRLWGFLIPPLDGEYVFWIAADDDAQLWLSSDDTAATRQLIATSKRIPKAGVGRMEWTRQPNQQSAPIRLQAGRRYLIEAVHKEGGGADHVEVGWRLPNESLERPIPGIHLSPPIVEPTPDVPVVTPATVTPPPVTTWTVVRAINLGGEAVEIDGVSWLGQRQAEDEGETPANSQQAGPWLSGLDWVSAKNGFGEVRRDRSTTGKQLLIAGKVYDKGLGVHAPCELVYAIDDRWTTFSGKVGIDDAASQRQAQVVFQVFLDGKKVWDSDVMRKNNAVKGFDIPVAGRKEMRLVVDPSGPSDSDHANWIDARFKRLGGNDGMLMVKTGKRTTAGFTPKPAVDAKMRSLLTSALGGTSKEGLEFSVRVPNGPLRVWLLVGESGTSNSRQFELNVDGTALPTMTGMATGAWQKIGPVDVVVTDELVTVKATPIKGAPQLMGFLAERPDQPKTSSSQLPLSPLSPTDPLALIPDAVGFSPIYQADLTKLAKEVPYEVDNTAKFSGAFTRVAYLLELQEANMPLRWVWTSMDAFTADVRQIGVPTVSSEIFFQQTVANLLVASNADGLPVGAIGDGVIEFWSGNYNPTNSANIPGATNEAYDFGDQAPAKNSDGYGSMQVHNLGAKQTVWAVNHWAHGNKADLGIGPSPTGGDWTFVGNGAAVVFKRLRVFVKPAP